VHIDAAIAEGHIEAAAAGAVGALEEGGDGLAEAAAAGLAAACRELAAGPLAAPLEWVEPLLAG
jgi:hypothetical protein